MVSSQALATMLGGGSGGGGCARVGEVMTIHFVIPGIAGRAEMARVPFGYRIEGDQMAINADEAAAVQRIFAEFTRPYIRAGLSEIADGLNVDGVPTQRGGKWYASTVRYILGNSIYADEPRAIITHGTYQQAQNRLATMRMGPTR